MECETIASSQLSLHFTLGNWSGAIKFCTVSVRSYFTLNVRIVAREICEHGITAFSLSEITLFVVRPLRCFIAHLMKLTQ